MKAKVGDFLVSRARLRTHDQHAEIIEVRAQDGSPPMWWLACDRPRGHGVSGSDAVVSRAEHTQAAERGVSAASRVGT